MQWFFCRRLHHWLHLAQGVQIAHLSGVQLAHLLGVHFEFLALEELLEDLLEFDFLVTLMLLALAQLLKLHLLHACLLLLLQAALLLLLLAVNVGVMSFELMLNLQSDHMLALFLQSLLLTLLL